jgi:UDP:flavonoid glycosyltransferase YjiC (YdhE family)
MAIIMRLTFLALGSTGDILPMATLAKALSANGYRPTFVTTEDYQSLLEKMGLPGRFVPGDAQQTIAKAGANTFRLMTAFAQLSRALPQALDLSATWLRESRAIINQLPIGLYGVDLAQRLTIPHIQTAVIPLTPNSDFPMMGWPKMPAFLPGYNKLGYWGYERLTWLTMRSTINRWRTGQLQLPALPGSSYLARWRDQPLLYGFSPNVVPRPTEWPENIQVTGYWFPQDDEWRPSGELTRFLQAGPAPLFIGFGSMPVPDPRATTEMIVAACLGTGLRAIVQAGWAGLALDDLPASVYRLDYAPYDWLFPRVAAVIHHGGSGTTAAGLRAGVPGMVTPFTFDQGFWGRRLADVGAGLPPIAFRRLTTTKMADSMVRLRQDEGLKTRAAAIGRRIREENGTAAAVKRTETILTGAG